MSVHLQNSRKVTVQALDAVPMPVEALKAAIKKVEQCENVYHNSLDATGHPQNLPAAYTGKTVLTGTNPFQVHVFDVQLNIETATYKFTYLETAPNVETATQL